MDKTMERDAAAAVAHPSTYGTILVHVEPDGEASAGRVGAAARLARAIDARLLGIGAETIDPGLFSGPLTGFAAGEWVAIVQAQIGKNFAAAEAAFRRDAAGAEIEWRTVQDHPHRALVAAAHAADLIIVSPRSDRSNQISADPADVVMTAGRPVLIVPDKPPPLAGRSVVVAWKNTRECRRALMDALPFLQRATDVVVLAVVRPDMADVAKFETDDVVANLRRHGAPARAMVNTITHAAAEDEIERVADQVSADLIVCGAYGHSRLREWAVGGVTDSFLREPKRFVLLTH